MSNDIQEPSKDQEQTGWQTFKLFYQNQPKFIKRQELMDLWRQRGINAKQISVHIL